MILRYSTDFQHFWLAWKHCWKPFSYSWFSISYLQDATQLLLEWCSPFRFLHHKTFCFTCPHVYGEHNASIFRVAATIHLPEITLVSHHPMAEAMETATTAIRNPNGLGQVLSSFPLPKFAKLTQTFSYKWHIFFHPTISASTWTSAVTLEDGGSMFLHNAGTNKAEL